MLSHILVFLLSLPLSAVSTNLHSPHDATYSAAAHRLADGREVVVIISSDQRLRVSWDDGITWRTKVGAGLGTAKLWTLSFHPEAASLGGEGLFLAGGHEGVWGFDPVTGDVMQLNTGLPLDDTWVMDLDSPLAGSDGPSIAVTEAGNVYLMDAQTLQWSHSLDVGGTFFHRVAVAVEPHYDSATAQTHLMAAAEGLLWFSDDGGQSWHASNRFQTRASSPTDWSICALAFAEDFAQSGQAVLGRIRFDTALGLEYGEIWSRDASGNFQLRKSLDSGIHSLIGTPPGPSGQGRFLAAARSYPNFRSFQDVGILSSLDGGITWSDFGNHQDFRQEDGPGMVSGNVEMGHEQEFVVMPEYGSEGTLWYVRAEGIFRSRNEGGRWLQVEPINDRRCRRVDSAFGPNGEKLVFTAGWGMGGVRYDRTHGTVEPLPKRSPMIFGRDMALSPNYTSDGLVMFTGNFDLWAWQDPPYLIRFEDHPGGPQAVDLQRNLNAASPNHIALHPDFANHPVIYMASDNLGILRLDTSSPSNQWTQVGTPVPTGHDDIGFSADFANDNLIYAATGFGLFEAEDRPDATWTHLTTTWLRDNTWDSVTTFSPNDPSNPKPGHPWNWEMMLRTFAPDEVLLGDEVLVAHHDGDFVVTETIASSVELLTFRGPQMGSITLSFEDTRSGQVLASTTVDLAGSPQLELTRIPLGHTHTGTVLLKAEAHLDPSEVFYFDGFRLAD